MLVYQRVILTDFEHNFLFKSFAPYPFSLFNAAFKMICQKIGLASMIDGVSI